ncbi:MAG: Diguanylate cyclase [Pseudomonadota bacterium]|nr:Diguanylate cyclase [Pseudomonadota bacterium]MDQ5918802.1 Diguanylate cyclase [Pseudomonadota bacterium]
MGAEAFGNSLEAAQLELIQDLGRIGYWEYDPSTHVFTLPPHSLDLRCSLIGCTPEEAPKLRDTMSDTERQRFNDALELAVKNRLALHIELKLIGFQGRNATILVKGKPIERHGRMLFAGTFSDITHEKRIETEREEILSQLHAVISGLPIGVTVFDEDLRLLFWNDHIYDILGLPQGAVYTYVRFEDLIRYPAERGEYGPGDPAELVAQRAALARKFQAHHFERAARDGGTLLVDGYPFRFGGRISGFVTTYTNITEQKENAAQIEHQRQVLKTIIDNIPAGISLFDNQMRLAAHNPLLSKLLDFPESLLKQPVVHFEDLLEFNLARGEYGAGDQTALRTEIMARVRNPQAHHMERRRPDGRMLEIIGVPVPGGGFVTIYSDITERKHAEEQIRNQALHDPLTQLPNRTSLNEMIEQELQRSTDANGQFALLFLDLDGFKGVNDSLGHDAGDELLKQVARRLTNSVRESDAVARLGGDEFVVLLRAIEGTEPVLGIAADLINQLTSPFSLRGKVASVGTSIGIAIHPDHGNCRESLLRAADEAMYQAKAAGKGTWRIASPDSGFPEPLLPMPEPA